MKRKFELFMSCLGNGVTVCNKAIMEHGDYKQIAHISTAGNIRWYVDPGSIPGADLLRIERAAEVAERKAREDLDRKFSADPAGTYYRMLDRLTAGQLVDFMNQFKDEPLDMKYVNLIPLYLKNI